MKTTFLSLALIALCILTECCLAQVESSTVVTEGQEAKEAGANVTEPTLQETKTTTATNNTVPAKAVEPEEPSTKTADSTQETSSQNEPGNATTGNANAETSTETSGGDSKQSKQQQQQQPDKKKEIAQVGPFIDLLGPKLLRLQPVDEKHAALVTEATNDALRGKTVVGLYFSADWCGPCRKFTPELVSFYNKMNQRMGKKGEFEIVWVSRCRDGNSFRQYFTHMNWLALPMEEALGARGQKLNDMYKVKGIPSLVLLDEQGEIITTDARNKVPQDKAGIGFPWRNPIATLYMTILPRSLRLMIRSQLFTLKDKLLQRVKTLLALKPASVNQ